MLTLLTLFLIHCFKNTFAFFLFIVVYVSKAFILFLIEKKLSLWTLILFVTVINFNLNNTVIIQVPTWQTGAGANTAGSQGGVMDRAEVPHGWTI